MHELPWSGEVLLAPTIVIASGVIYALARSRPSVEEQGWPRAGLFATGVAALAAALAPPLDAVTEERLSAHMIQHVLLVSVAAPLLVFGFPRRAIAEEPAAPVVRPLALLVAAAVVQVATLLGWHVPLLFDAAVDHAPVHALEHVSLLLTAMLVWIAVVRLPRRAAVGGMLVLFVLAFPPMVLGVGLALAGTPWYAAYRRAPLEEAVADQQLAGVVMWAYAGAALAIAFVLVTVRWLAALEADSPGHSSRLVGSVDGGR